MKVDTRNEEAVWASLEKTGASLFEGLRPRERRRVARILIKKCEAQMRAMAEVVDQLRTFTE